MIPVYSIYLDSIVYYTISFSNPIGHYAASRLEPEALVQAAAECSRPGHAGREEFVTIT